MLSRIAPLALAVACGAGAPSAPDGGHTLADSLERLSVRRVLADGSVEAGAAFDPSARSARAMHERGGEPGEGEVHGAWALGPEAWDAVGATRQRSGGELREGLWAHPRNGSTLVIGADVAPDADRLEGFAGFTDFALHWSSQRGVTAPVQLELRLDGARLGSFEVARAPGWQPLSVALPERAGGDGPRRLEVRIRSDADKWAHFVFDLWPAGGASNAG